MEAQRHEESLDDFITQNREGIEKGEIHLPAPIFTQVDSMKEAGYDTINGISVHTLLACVQKNA